MSSDKNSNENSQQLKEKLLNKLKGLKSELNTLKTTISNDLSEQKKKIHKSYENYISSYKKQYNSLIKEKKEKANKNIQCYEFWKIITNARELEEFTLYLSDIVKNSIENYNNFLLNKLPYYKKASRNYMLNESQRLYYNHIFAKLSKNQIDLIYNKIKDSQLLSFINCNYPIDMNIEYDNSEKVSIDTISRDTLNKLVISRFTEEDYNDFFTEESLHESDDSKVNELLINNCDLRKSDLSLVPYNIRDLIIVQSNITYKSLEKKQFNSLVSLILDNNNLDSENFSNIFTSLFKNDNVCNNLKLISAKNNSISRIIQDTDLEKITNKLNSLEIFNLSNNNIYNINIKLFDLIPNLKIMDLSDNSLNREIICKNLINRFHGLIILNNNLGIMNRAMNQVYLKYYIDKLNSNQYPLYSINTENIFYKRNCDNISKINFSIIRKQYNIREINLSSSFINNSSMIKILNDCIGFNNNITKMNLSHNLLTHDFFALLIENCLDTILDKLLELDLSFNPIDFIKANKIKENIFLIFLNSFNQLDLLNIKETPLEGRFNSLIKINVIRYHEKKKTTSEKKHKF